MKSGNKFIIAAAISAAAFGAYADDAATLLKKKTPTSQNYVDTQVGTKQNKIPISGTNTGTPGTTVVTYTGTAGQIGERGIYDGSGNYNSGTDANKLATAGMVKGAISAIPTVETSKLVCANSPACTLWTIQDQTVHGSSGGSGSGNSGNNSCGLYDWAEVWIISGSGQAAYCNDDIISCDTGFSLMRYPFNEYASIASLVPANVTNSSQQLVLVDANDIVSCINSKGHCTAEARCVQ